MPKPNGRLTAHDSVFLYWERPEQPMHVAECMVYDGHITAADVITMIDQRLHLLPRYVQKVIPAPFGLAHPMWVDDPDFDLSKHVDEREIPAPGDDRALSRIVGELYCDLLDRDQPLWHVTVLHGLADGGTVLFIKLHHSMVDGVASVELIEVLHSTERGASMATLPIERPDLQPLPGTVRRLTEALADNTQTVLDRARALADLRKPGQARAAAKRLSTVARTLVDIAPDMLSPLSPTPFNAPIHAKRDFAWVEIPFEEVREVKAALGGTVNDVVLAVLSGGLAAFMRRNGSDPDGRELSALCPVSVRAPDQSGAGGNLISMVVVPLYVGIDDPADRLNAERQAMESLKEREQGVGFHELISSAEWWPAPLYKALWKLWPRGYFPLHITSTNVPGPRQPLFLGDHELLHWYPFGVQWTNNGLFLCTLSYRENLILGPVSDPEVVTDVWEFAADLRTAFDELRAAAGLPSSSDAVAQRAKPPTRATGRRSP